MNHKSKESIIILGAGVLTEPMIKRSSELGLHTIVFEFYKDAPGLRFADEVRQVNLKDIKLTVECAREVARHFHVKGVATCGAELAACVSSISRALSLPGISLEVVLECDDKMAMRHRLTEAGIDHVRWAHVHSLEEALKAADKVVGYPCVLKPRDNCGSRGVKRVIDPEDLKNWFGTASGFSQLPGVLIEQYLDGPRQTIEMLVYGGEESSLREGVRVRTWWQVS